MWFSRGSCFVLSLRRSLKIGVRHLQQYKSLALRAKAPPKTRLKTQTTAYTWRY